MKQTKQFVAVLFLIVSGVACADAPSTGPARRGSEIDYERSSRTIDEILEFRRQQARQQQEQQDRQEQQQRERERIAERERQEKREQDQEKRLKKIEWDRFLGH